MGIIARFRDIMAANINALLDKAEDPEKMIDQLMRDLVDNLADVKKETAGVIVAEKSAEREMSACKKEIEELTAYDRRMLEKHQATREYVEVCKAQLEAEQVVLGCIIFDNSVLSEISAKIKIKDFI